MTGPEAVSKELAAELLERALSRGGDFADLYFEYRRTASISMEDGRVRSVGGSVDMGVGIRVVLGQAVGYAYAESLEPGAMAEAAETAARIASGSATHKAIKVRRRRAKDAYALGDTEIVDVDGKARVELLRRADRAARAASAEVVRVDASLVAVHKEILVVSSRGDMVYDFQPMCRMSVMAVARRDSRVEQGSSSGGGRMGLEYFESVSPEDHGEEATRVAVLNLDSREAPAGTMPVVLAPGDSGILLHEAVGHGLEADFNRKRTSNYTDQLGESVASELVTVVDDPALASSRGSINVDDEGVLPKNHRLIEGGILKGYLHDRISADWFKTRPSGSGRRQSFRHPPMPRMTNTFMEAGQDDPEDIIKSVDRGIYARKFSGGQVNISNGDFVFSLTEGYLIEKGKLTAPLKGVNLIGNGPEALATVSMVGHDFELSDGMWTCGKDGQSVPVGVGMPTVKLDALTVGGSKIG
ncbi:peptidase U62, modulator of DNA gyrase [Plesiocystis pacifica SIR-1]|uniref:Peptidase U62, modulator of DNA gyrase n=1 Tax=Plesiocystis pacifica SIR-1 TaxID=391625 RepID=A6G738_9BACT|nr:metallopeptidase TldD-related protein [Plesiocystis pacifica]EDM78314.1 peptidase U62, modulator of DNA gyrase [Plesiocystis pacifica SIR-1]